MDELKQYYNTVVNIDNIGPDFSKLNDEQRLNLEKSFGFASFKIRKAVGAFLSAVKSEAVRIYGSTIKKPFSG